MTLVLQKEFWSQQVLYVYLFAWLITLKWNALGWSGEIILEVDCLTKMSEEPSGGGTTFSLVAIPFYTILYIQSSTYNPLHTFLYIQSFTYNSFLYIIFIQSWPFVYIQKKHEKIKRIWLSLLAGEVQQPCTDWQGGTVVSQVSLSSIWIPF